MKKIVKITALSLLIVIILITLSGCGDKIVATKSGNMFLDGTFEETWEITFKKDKPSSITITFTFEEEEDAKLMYKRAPLVFSDSFSDVNVSRKGNQVTVELGLEGSLMESLSKSDIVKQFEEEGFTIK